MTRRGNKSSCLLAFGAVLLCAARLASALEPVMLRPMEGRYSIGRHLEYLDDTERSWTIDDVTSAGVSSQFIPSDAGTLNFGISTSAYWVRFRLRNDSANASVWLLEVDWPLTDSLDLYVPEKPGTFAVRKGGDLLPFNTREIAYRNPLFRLTLEAGADQTFYMRFEGGDSLFVPLVLWSHDSFIEKRLRENYIFGVFLGILVVMIFYNLFVFLSIRDRGYLLYVLAMTSMLGWQLCLTGLAAQYLWPNYPRWGNYAVHVGGVSTGIFFFSFVRAGLMTRLYVPVIDKLLRATIIAGCFGFLLSLVSARAINTLSAPVGVVAVSTSIFAAMRTWQKGFAPAWDFLVAWLFCMLALVVWALDVTYDVFSSDLVRTYSLPASSVIAFILFSRGLTRRITALKQERDRAYALARGIDRFMVELSQCEKIEELALRTGEELNGLLRPATCTIYLRSGQRYTPIFVRGPVVPPDLDARSPLARSLEKLQAAADVTELLHNNSAADQDTDRTTLEGLQAAVVLPIHRRAELSAFVCLGAKQSGEVYTETELALLSPIAGKISTELLRFDDAKLASIGEGMARMMHDLRNPLAIASGYMDFISQARTAEEREELAELVQQQFRLMERMAGDLLAYARGESSVLIGKVHLNQFVVDLRRQLDLQLAGSGVQLVIESEFAETAHFDQSKLLRAIANLARNSAEAMPNGGILRIKVSRADERLIFDVTDTGVGIPPEVQARLFTPFATAGKSGGTGLGLLSVKRLVEEHHGSISVRSEGGQGTTFTIELPLHPEPQAAVTQSAPHAHLGADAAS